MTPRKALLVVALVLVAGIAGWFVGHSSSEAAPSGSGHAAETYQCPMHPWITSDHPGKCTVCGMSLVARNATSPGATTMPKGVVALGASQVTAMGVETSTADIRPLTRTLRVTGRIEDDDTRHRILSARVPGRIEKLYIKIAGQEIVAGERLATIYSPEILSAERIYIERVKAGGVAYSAAELATARERLQALGLSEADFAALEESRQPSAILDVRAPEGGTVVTKFAYEGQYVQASDRLFEIADFSTMWFAFDAYGQDVPWLRAGLMVDITTANYPGETINAPIVFIDPNFDETTNTTKVRAVFANRHFTDFESNHITVAHRVPAAGVVHLSAPVVLTVPRSAVLDAGSGPVAYVDSGGQMYEQRVLTLGRRGDDLVEVLDGLKRGDKVVTRGALLIDAQAQLSFSDVNRPLP